MKTAFFLLILVLFIGCQNEETIIAPPGLNSLINISNEPIGRNCSAGGIKVDVGIDNNSNGMLDVDEILNTSYVCNGVDGYTSLTSVTTEPKGPNCENGGIKINSGIDNDGNKVLDDDEITSTAYICNGLDGNNSLTKITSVEVGTNCENGGLKIDSGIDINNNGILEDEEIMATAYACNGFDGNISLVSIKDESPGENCDNGGIKIDSGIDDNGNKILDNEEIDITRFLCNGEDGKLDEEIRIKIEMPLDFEASDELKTTSSSYIFAGVGIPEFDINYYVGVDSIVFTSNPSNHDVDTKTYLELYDYTNNSSITNSEISRMAIYYDKQYVFSQNIYSDLPRSKIDIGIRLRSEVEGNTAYSGYPYLILYRKN